jgi:hypothetical protein
MVGAEHSDSGTKLGSTKGDHVLPDVSSNDFAMLRGGIVQDPLDEVVSVLIARDVNQGDAGTITTSFADSVEVAAQELSTTNLETLLNHLRGELIGAVLGSVANDMVDCPATVGRSAVLADVLDAPVSELAMGNNVNVGEDLLDTGALLEHVSKTSKSWRGAMHLVLFKAIFKDVLDDEAAGFTQSYLMPHAHKRLIDILHDLRGGFSPPKLKKLLPDMTSVSMDDRLRDPAQKLMNHDSLEVFRNRIESLLNNMAPERIHGEVQGVASNGLGNVDDLFRRSVLKATLHKKVAKAVDHERIGLSHDSLDNLELLLGGTDLELLLQEDGSLLIIVANDLVDDILPVAVNVSVQQTTVVEWLRRREVCLVLGRHNLYPG